MKISWCALKLQCATSVSFFETQCRGQLLLAYHNRNPKWLPAGHFECEQYQNWKDYLHYSSPQSTRFHENISRNPDRLTDVGENIMFFVEEIIITEW